jgi:uncharacterized protein
MHVRDERAFTMTDQVLPLIDACDAFAAEFHLQELSAPENGQRIILPQGTSLEDYMTPRKFSKIRRILLKTADIDLLMFKDALPFVIVNLVGAQMLQAERPVALDAYLWDYAHGAGKAMHGIETFGQQLKTLDSIPVKKQVKMLLGTVRNISGYRRKIHHYASLYQRGELRLLHKLMKKSSGGLRKLLLYDRNVVMAQRIEDLAGQTSVFAAVGAGHLLGGKGLIRLLKKRGMKVKPVKMRL